MAKAKQFDAAEYLDSPELIAAYLTEAIETNDQSLIIKAIGNAARALRDVKPEFGTIIKVLHALGPGGSSTEHPASSIKNCISVTSI
jgi:DNA-binding phage protein